MSYISNLFLFSVFIPLLIFSGAIMKNHCSNPADVEKDVASWLRNSSDRNGGRKKRQLERQRQVEGDQI